jgi:hypothetical protein
MTTPAKIEANRRNARLSTGPRSAAGKAIVATNPIRHGIFASLPVVAGENPYDWEQHRAGVVAALAPVGLLEVNLAERAALLLWQLARLGRYQAAATTEAVEDAILLPPDTDPVERAHFPVAQREDDYLKCTELNLRIARKNHADEQGAADLLRRLGDPTATGPVNRAWAGAVLDWAYGLASHNPLRKFMPESYSDPGFPSRIGAEGVGTEEVLGSAEWLGRALDYYADAAGETPAEFRANVQTAIDGRAAAHVREVSRLEAEAAAILRRAESRRSRAADAALLPPEPIAERVMKYEKHLHGLLTSTLHELERLQARRGGMPVIPPVVADIQVTGSVGEG